MKCKRILSMLLTLCMVMSLFAGTTVTASAADGETTTLYVNGVDMLNGSSTVGGVSYNKETNTLTLTNAELSTPYSGYVNDAMHAAVIYSTGNLTINLVGSSTITYSTSGEATYLAGIVNTGGNLKFTGSGSLTIKNGIDAAGNNKRYYGICSYGALTVDNPTITIDAEKTMTCAEECGVLVAGAFAIEKGTVTIRTWNTTTSSNIALCVASGTNSTLGSGAKLIAEAGNSGDDTKSYGIMLQNSSLKLKAGASLRASGGKQALSTRAGTISAASTDLTLSATGSTTHKAATEQLQTISSDSKTLTSSRYKTLEVTASNTPAQYATAVLKLNGYTAGAAFNQATITTTSNTGFESISLAGFMAESDGKFDPNGNFDGTKTYYVGLEMPRSTGYELQEDGGKPVGVTLEGATPQPLKANRNFLIFKMNSKPAATAPTFTDGFGKTIENAASYEKGTTTNDKGYTFAGWFGDDGNELASAGAAVAGTTYTAKWTKNDKTVRTKALDLTKIDEENTFGATLTGGVYTNADEGWSWNPTTKTLMLSGATMDIQLDSKSYIGIHLPADGILTTAANMENKVSVNAESHGAAITGAGNITVEGQGTLSVIGVTGGICTDGDITINAPISVSITGEETAAIYIESEQNHSITIHDALNILTPAGGRINTDRGTYIAESDGTTPARNVVIGVAKKYTVTYNTNGGSAVVSATVSEGHKLTAPEAPTKDGYTFHGWYKDAAFTNRWNFDTDTVTEDVTLYAKWSVEPVYSISGTVKKTQNDDSETAISGATVELKKGTDVIASVKTDENGSYTFTYVPSGEYNIVVTNKAGDQAETMTQLVTVSNANQGSRDIILPKGSVSAVVEVKPNTPAVLAGGLDAEAKAEDGKKVTVKLVVESKAEADASGAAEIKQIASGKTLEYLDLAVQKTVDNVTTAIDQTNNVLEIVVPFQTSGRNNITVYRHHASAGSTAETKALTRLDTRPTSSYTDETYYVGDGYVVIYAQKFSTYAIGYNTQSGGGSGSGGSSSGGGSSSSSGSSSSGNSSTISTPSAKNGTVSVSPKSASKGTTVTVTVTPDKGYVLETLTVTDASGKKLDLKNLGSGKYSFTMPASKVEVKATFMEDNTMLNYFVDVPASAYYYDAVLWAAEQGITGGTDATHFSPDGVCTRAQAVTFLWRAAGSPAPSATAMPFTDVAADSYYYNAVLWAMENGITVGTSSTTFSPDLKCSRAHIMTFLWRSEKSPAAGSVNPFTDVSADAYYADAVLWAVKESVTNGTSSATFSPDADCTRAQIVTFIWRTLAR